MDFKDRIVELRRVESSSLIPHPMNWRIHDSEQRGAMESVLSEVGIAGAVIAYDSKQYGGLTVIDGHLRKDLLAEQKVPVLVLNVSDEEAAILLATHDRIGEMAIADEDALTRLIETIPNFFDAIPELAPSPSMSSTDGLLTTNDIFADTDDAPKYPLVPHFDEAYDALVIVCKKTSEFSWLVTTMNLGKKQSKTKVGMTRVISLEEFREKWENRVPAATIAE
jgi:hypothetical protein